jgi:Fe-S-cluster-containing hydrogenase component 2
MDNPPVRCVIELDKERCSFCEFCVQTCPARAFRVEQDEDQIRLYFTPVERRTCSDDDCVAICPEDAIRLVDGDPAPEELLMAQSDLLVCSYCGARFAPAQKLQAVSQEGRAHNEPVRDHCPVCRRKHLVVSFIEDRLLPEGGKAEYRSGADIIRKAGYGPGPNPADLED